MSQLQYRADIDGLRAIAILTVILFHAGLGLTGGFVGVDVFFVISGFLISSIIVKEIGEKRFSILAFYKRRSLRILPALFLVILASFVAGWFILPPFDYKKLADSAMASVAFYPNFYFYNNSNYFAAEAITQPLLHIWSLGVEEQFYFLAPGLLLLAAKFPRWRTPTFIAVFVASLAFSAYMLGPDASFSFYMLPTRAFEMMIGMGLALGLVPAFRSALLANLAGLLGLGMILVAAVVYTEATPFPGLQALLPCLGAALLIHANGLHLTVSGRLLSLPPVVFIGKISYSLYLWHWPVLVFATYQYGPVLDMPARIAAMLLAALAATVSYYLVEQPIRIGGAKFRARNVVGVSVAAILLWLVPTQVIKKADGLPMRLPAEAAQFAATNPVKVAYPGLCHDPELQDKEGMNCEIGATGGKPQFLMMGDSHTAAIAAKVGELAVQKGLPGHALFRGGCAPVMGLGELTTGVFDKCVELFDSIDDILARNPIRSVIIHARWAVYETGQSTLGEAPGRPRLFVAGDLAENQRKFEDMLTKTVETVAKGRHVTIIGPVPEIGFNLPAEMIKALMQKRSADLPIDRALFDERQKDVLPLLQRLDQIEGVDVVYPHELLCDATKCRTQIDGKALYVDDDHLSPTGAELLIPFVERALQ